MYGRKFDMVRYNYIKYEYNQQENHSGKDLTEGIVIPFLPSIPPLPSMNFKRRISLIITETKVELSLLQSRDSCVVSEVLYSPTLNALLLKQYSYVSQNLYTLPYLYLSAPLKLN